MRISDWSSDGCSSDLDRAHGYCIDDNARALMLLNSLDPRAFAENDALALRYASFVQHAWNPAIGRFRNFMGYDRHWLEEGGSEDSNGRALRSEERRVGKACVSPWSSRWSLCH